MALQQKLISNEGIETNYYKIVNIDLVCLPKESYVEVALNAYTSETYRQLETEDYYTRAAGRLDYRLPYTEGEPLDRAHIYARIKAEVPNLAAAVDV